jgi:hypothetical protein
MTDSGYFVFSAKGALLVASASTQGSSTSARSKIDNDPETWAVVVGRSIKMDYSIDKEIQRELMSKTGKPKTFAALTRSESTLADWTCVVLVCVPVWALRV